MASNYHPLVEKFLINADPYDYYKSNHSCWGYFHRLNKLFKELGPEFNISYLKTNERDRSLFLDSYIKHVQQTRNNYIAGTENDAAIFLKQKGLSLEDVFEIEINKPNLSQNEFPGFFKHTYKTMYDKEFDYKILDLHSAFIFYISEHFIAKLLNFFEKLRIPEQIDCIQPSNFPYVTEFSLHDDKPLLQQLVDYINMGILQFELFVKGNNNKINYHNIPQNFESFLDEIKNEGNFTQVNLNLLDEYYKIFSDILYYDRMDKYYGNIDVQNIVFKKMLSDFNECIALIESFVSKYTLIPDDAPKQHSVINIMLNKGNSHNIINSTANKKAAKSIKIYAYKYKDFDKNYSAISDLLNALQKMNFLDNTTDIKNFRKIFNNTEPDKPIIWTGYLSELTYFIKYLHNESNLIEKISKDIWKVTASIFVDSNKQKFDYKLFRGQKRPKRAEIIENIINLLK
jgi:hypothetical protein